MWIDIDLDQSDLIISGPGVRDEARLFRFKRDTDGELAVRFWRSGVQVELAEDAVGYFGIKPAGEFDGDLLVYADEWTKTGTADETVYTFTPEFNGVALKNLLGLGDGDVENDIASIMAMLEIKWVADGKKHRTQTVDTEIFPEVLQDLDGLPLAFPNLWDAPLQLTTPPQNGDETSLAFSGLTGAGFTSPWVRDLEVNGKWSWFSTADPHGVQWTGTRWEVIDAADVICYSDDDTDHPPADPARWTVVAEGVTAPTFAFGGTAATALDQAAHVTATVGGVEFKDRWWCSRVHPVEWQPPGNIFRDTVTGTLYRQFFASGAPDYAVAY
jgi:hypothetical protein